MSNNKEEGSLRDRLKEFLDRVFKLPPVEQRPDNLTISNFNDASRDNVLVLDASITRSDVSLVASSGDDNDINESGIAGTSDTFIAGQGTETFRESAWGSVTVSYAAGDGNLTISNFNDFSHNDDLVLDASIARSDVSLAVSGSGFTLTDGVSGDEITITNRFMDTLEFADGTTMALQASGGSAYTRLGLRKRPLLSPLVRLPNAKKSATERSAVADFLSIAPQARGEVYVEQ